MNELEILESKIYKAIDLIESLFQKNQDLKKENDRLTKQIKEKDQLIDDLIQGKQSLLSEEDSKINNFTEKEEKIRLKIQQILEKLESFQKLSNNIDNF